MTNANIPLEMRVFRAVDNKVRQWSTAADKTTRILGEACFASPSLILKLPTSLRRNNENVSFLDRTKNSGTPCIESIGAGMGLAISVMGIAYTAEQAVYDNYLPAAIILGTNAVSGIYEVVRAGRKAQQEATATMETQN